MEPVNVSDPTLWAELGKVFGPGGVALLIGFAAALYGCKMLWDRLKEKDAECRTEMTAAEARWETRFQQMRSDVKEGFVIVAKLTEQVTILTEKVNATRML